MNFLNKIMMHSIKHIKNIQIIELILILKNIIVIEI